MIIRKATEKDLPQIIKLLAHDPLGKQRECYQEPLPEVYTNAFAEINADRNNFLAVIENENTVIGTLQLTFIPYLTYQGGKRALIEGVRIDEAYRGKGVGKQLIEWAIEKSREQGCHMVQLTTDKNRPEALEFYKKLGFSASHEGLKMQLLQITKI